jgi:hypothetical protein
VTEHTANIALIGSYSITDFKLTGDNAERPFVSFAHQ